MTVAARLAGWAAELDYRRLPEPVRQAVRRHLLDGLGTTVAAARTGAAEAAVTVARGLGGPEQATVLAAGSPVRVGAPAAALANGVLAHALDFDDTHAGGLVHATAPVLPTVLAVGEETGARGAEVLAAAAAGLETVCRLGAAVPHGFHSRGLHATAVCGVLASALAAARLYGLSRERTAHALGIAGSRAGGLLEFLNTGGSTKQLHPGFAAADGILAARLAAAGATGPAAVVEGDYGLYGALLGLKVAPETIEDGLGERWELTRITIKPYPVCQLSHAALDAAAQVLGALAGRDVHETQDVLVDVHPDAAALVCGPGKDRPATGYAAKFSLPWCVAALLIDGALTPDTFDRPGREDVTELAGRIRHRTTHTGGVAADQPGHIRLRLGDGTTLTASVPHSGGGPDDPGLDELVRTKALHNLGGGRASEAVAAEMDALGTAPSLTALLGALTATLTIPVTSHQEEPL